MPTRWPRWCAPSADQAAHSSRRGRNRRTPGCKAPLRRRAERGRNLTFAQYLRFRLGTASGRTVWFNFIIKPFGASSFAGFWRQWNPVYGYVLYNGRAG